MSARRGTTALVAAAVLAAGARPAPAADEDPWLGKDKALHFGLSAALAGGGYGATALVWDDTGPRLIGGAALAAVAGLGKELHDLAGPGDASWRDLTWDAIGTAAGLAVAWTIDRLVFRLVLRRR